MTVSTPEARRWRVGVYLLLAGSLFVYGLHAESTDRKLNGLIQAQHERDYADCQRRVANVERLNTLYEGLVRIEAKNPFRFTSPQTVNDRIRLFTAAQLTIPKCGKKP